VIGALADRPQVLGGKGLEADEQADAAGKTISAD
jgi:hypothetical protein